MISSIIVTLNRRQKSFSPGQSTSSNTTAKTEYKRAESLHANIFMIHELAKEDPLGSSEHICSHSYIHNPTLCTLIMPESKEEAFRYYTGVDRVSAAAVTEAPGTLQLGLC